MGDFSEEMTEKEARLLQILSTEILDLEPGFKVTADLFDAGLDSMSIMRLLILIESAFGYRIPVSQVSRENFASVRMIASLLPSA